MYVIAPALAIAWYSLREAPSLRDALKVGRSFAGVLLIGGFVASSWYLLNWRSILGFALSAGFGKLSINYGNANVFSPEVVWQYLAEVIAVVLSCYYGVLLLSLLPIWAVRTWPRIFKPKRTTLAIWLWILVPLTVMTFSVNKDPRYAAPLLPAVALGLAALMTQIADRRPPLRRYAALLVVVPILAYATASLPALGFLGELRLGRWVFWSPHLWWYASVPGGAGEWGQSQIVEMICRDARQWQPDARVFIPLQHRYLNNENLAYLAARQKCDVQIVGLPQDMRGAKEVEDWIQGIKPSYVLVTPSVPDPDLAPPFANLRKQDAEQIVARPESGFKLMYRGSLEGVGKEILIYRRNWNDT
jgi:hypothetical protein